MFFAVATVGANMTENSRQNNLTIYRPNQRHELGFFETWSVMTGNILKSRELIWQLFKRDFLGSYKKSFLGIAWIFLTPLAAIVSWVFLQKTGLLNPGDVSVPYPVYVLLGSTMWGLYMSFYTAANSTLTAGQALIMQVNYPHEVLLFKQTAEQLANFTIGLVLNIIVLLFFQIKISWAAVFFPVVILPLFFMGASIGLISSMISIVAVDLSKAITMLMGILMWATPIVYSPLVDNHFVKLINKWNPLTYLVCSARDIILFGRLYDPLGFFICTALSFLLFLLSWRLFFVAEYNIIERMI